MEKTRVSRVRRRGFAFLLPSLAVLLASVSVADEPIVATTAPSSPHDHQAHGLTTSEDVDGEHCHTPALSAEAAPTIELGGLDIPDLELLDQDGNRQRFVSQVLGHRQVVINFVFTTCTTVCPPMGATFGRLQEILDDRLGDEVALVSISVDPAVDTPERLAAWAQRFGRRDGWTLLTGPKPEVDRLLKALQVFTPDKIDHAPTVLLGDTTRGRWQRAYGLASPSEMVSLLDGLAVDTSRRAELAEGAGR